MSWEKVRASIGPFGWWFRYEIGENEYFLNFEAYPVAATCADGTEEFLVDEDMSSGFTPDMEKAKPRFTGFVKWDGCIEYYLEQEHQCGKRDVEEFGEALKFAHALCLHIPKVDKKIAGYE